MLASLLQFAGLAAVTVGAALWALPLGLIVGGLALILVGLALERGTSA